jgi:hypothetical protein
MPTHSVTRVHNVSHRFQAQSVLRRISQIVLLLEFDQFLTCYSPISPLLLTSLSTSPVPIGTRPPSHLSLSPLTNPSKLNIPTHRKPNSSRSVSNTSHHSTSGSLIPTCLAARYIAAVASCGGWCVRYSICGLNSAVFRYAMAVFASSGARGCVKTSRAWRYVMHSV